MPPNAPSELAASQESANSFLLTWNDNSDNEGGFIVERRQLGYGFEEIASLPSDSTSYFDDSLLFATQYFYRVGATSGSDNPEYSNEVTITSGERLDKEKWARAYRIEDALITAEQTVALTNGKYVGLATKDGQSLLMGLDEFGRAQWGTEFTFEGVGGDFYIRSIEETSDGNIVAYGFLSPFGGESQAFLMKVDTTNGSKTWLHTFALYVENEDNPYNGRNLTVLDEDKDGVTDGFLIAGYRPHNDRVIHLLKFSAIGELLWARGFGASARIKAGSVVQDADLNSYILAHYVVPETEMEMPVVIKTDQTGNLLFARYYTPYETGNGYARARIHLADTNEDGEIGSNDGVAVIGYIDTDASTSGKSQPFYWRIGPEGTVLSSIVYDDADGFEVGSIADSVLDQDSNPWLLGGSGNGFWVAKLGTDGSIQESFEIQRAGNILATSIEIASDGQPLVTAKFPASGIRRDYVIWKFGAERKLPYLTGGDYYMNHTEFPMVNSELTVSFSDDVVGQPSDRVTTTGTVNLITTPITFTDQQVLNQNP